VEERRPYLCLPLISFKHIYLERDFRAMGKKIATAHEIFEKESGYYTVAALQELPRSGATRKRLKPPAMEPAEYDRRNAKDLSLD
jgi:hypothetical protein